MGLDPTLWAIIRRYSPQYGLDPRAVASIAMNESSGRRNAVGDSGTSFGAFQLHRGGALPAGKGLAWASSLPGILYALRQMSASGARGLHGQAAVSAIARNFERPANPGAEIATALSYYRNPGFARGGGGPPVRMGGGGGGGGGGGAPRMAPPLSPPVLPPIQVQPMAPMAPAQNALQAFIAAHTPQADPNQPVPTVASLFPSSPGSASYASELSSIHSKLVK
jgi:hypothetical protein